MYSLTGTPLRTKVYGTTLSYCGGHRYVTGEIRLYIPVYHVNKALEHLNCSYEEMWHNFRNPGHHGGHRVMDTYI